MRPLLRRYTLVASLGGAVAAILIAAVFETSASPGQSKKAIKRVLDAAELSKAPPMALTGTGSLEPKFSMSQYQAQVARSTLSTLDEMEGAARRRGDTVLMARLENERTRVLRAATRLPATPPVRDERNQP